MFAVTISKSLSESTSVENIDIGESSAGYLTCSEKMPLPYSVSIVNENWYGTMESPLTYFIPEVKTTVTKSPFL